MTYFMQYLYELIDETKTSHRSIYSIRKFLGFIKVILKP